MAANDDHAAAAIAGRPNALFGTWRTYAVALGVGFGACVVLNGVLRHLGSPARYPLLAADTYQVDPDGNPFRALTDWRPIDTGDFRPIYDAARGRREDSDFRMYRPELLKQNVSSFVYTPFTAFLVSPLARPGVSLHTAAGWVSGINHLMWAAGGVMLLLMMTHRGQRPLVLIALFVVHYVAYYPMAKALQLTQASVWIFFFLALSAYLFRRRRDIPAGAALALGVSIKPHLVVILVLVALTPRFPWRLIVSAIVGLVVTTGASMWYAGIWNCRDYVFETLPVLSAGYAYFPNQSINGMLHRLFTQTDPETYNLAPAVGWIKTASAVFGLALLAIAAVGCRRRREAAGDDALVLKYALAITAATIASPVCWMHHLTALLIAFAAGVGYLRANPAARTRVVDALMLASFLLTGFFFDTRHLGNGAIALLSGPGFYGALILFACLLALAWRRPVSTGEASG